MTDQASWHPPRVVSCLLPHSTRVPIQALLGWSRRHPKTAWLTAYFLAATAAAYLFYLRFPNNFTAPNFYAEDGTI